MNMERKAGILLPISSLPGDYGIGTFGKQAREFANFLNKANITYWQILPLNQTSFGDSPYSSFSTYAGNPYFIDFDLLLEEGLLKQEDYSVLNWGSDPNNIDYELIYINKYKVLRIAASNYKEDGDYYRFESENKWLNDYAEFMAIKNYFNGKQWLSWPSRYKKRDSNTINKFKDSHQEDIRFYKIIQYFFYKQWIELKTYCNNLNIKIIGDCPIYVAMDSSDVYTNKQYFKISSKYIPTKVAGVPPDYFSEDGQLWGNPLYKWNVLKKNNYVFWIKRIKHLSKIYDVIRIDHFRGFESYYEIPYGMTNGKIGEWKKGPGYSLFKEIKNQLGDIDIIAEDLGIITPSVKRLLKKCGYPGMKVLEFAFDSDDSNPYLPKNCKKNSVMYCGTHDNSPILSWIHTLNDYTLNRVKMYCKIDNLENINFKLIELMLKSKSNLAIIQAQDLLGLGEEARMNEPNTIGKNWKWRASANSFDEKLANRLSKLLIKYKRAK